MFLSDQQLAEVIRSGELKISSLDENGAYDDVEIPLDADLPKSRLIQPSSIDLTIGRIYVPPPEPRNAIDTAPVDFETGHVLGLGETAVVQTREHLTLGKGIGAFGFPPAGVSRNSILMTNPGHVDPGYSGHLTFTLINMGRKPYPLRRGERIASLLIFTLSQHVLYGYLDRNSPQPAKWAKLLDQLSPDFGAFETRMAAEAHSAVAAKVVEFDRKIVEARNIFSRAQLMVPLVTALAAGLLGYYTTTSGFAKSSELDTLSNRLVAIEAQLRTDELKAQLLQMKQQIQRIEDGLALER